MLTVLRHPTVALLFAGQALFWSCSIIGITLTSLVGLRLAPWSALATLPLALLVLAYLVAVQPLSMYMQRHGRRRGLVLGALAGVAGGLVAAAGVVAGSFWLFCAGVACVGVYQASAAYYRFAALEAVAPAQRGRAAACVVGGGVCAALLAPALSLWAQGWLRTPFAGAYLALAALAALGALSMSRLPAAPATPARERAGPGAWQLLITRPALRAAVLMTAIGQGLMVLAMNSTPLAMQACGFSAATAAQVIQWHVLGMFLPAFVAGPLVDRWGSRRVAVLGAGLLAASALLAASGLELSRFLISSFMLGVGWNLMVIAGTTLLGDTHAPHERGRAQALMELCNGGASAAMSFASGALLVGVGWTAVNVAMLPLVVLALATLRRGRGRRPAEKG